MFYKMDRVNLLVGGNRGTGFILDTSNEDVDGKTCCMHKVAVISGYFDQHRNKLGDLWVNDYECSAP